MGSLMSFSKMSSVSSNSAQQERLLDGLRVQQPHGVNVAVRHAEIKSACSTRSGVNMRLALPEISMPSSRTACTAYGLGGWPSHRPEPGRNPRENLRFRGRRGGKFSFRHRAAADIAVQTKRTVFITVLTR